MGYRLTLAAALLWYDTALMFGEEVRSIWSRKFTCATISYVFVRYANQLVYTLLAAETLLGSNLGEEVCLT